MATKVQIRRKPLPKPENTSGHKVLPIIALIAAFALGVYDGGAGLLQKHVFSKRYWTKQLGPLQEELQRYNELSADNAVLLGEAKMKAKFAVAQVLRKGGYSQEVLDANRDEIEKTEREIEAMCLRDAKDIAGHLDKLIGYTQGQLAEAASELGKRQGKPRIVRVGEL